MALKAGRVGVRKDQVDVHGKITGSQYQLPVASADTLGGVKVGNGLAINDGVLSNSNPTPYSLPIADASTLGGVKAVTKTEAMTKEVGIDSDGKLYVEPSSGGGVEVGKATLLSGFDGSIDYVTFGNLCYVFGKITLSANMNTYSSKAICTGIPCELNYDFIVPTIFPSTKYDATSYNSPTVAAAFLEYDSTNEQFNLITRAFGMSASNASRTYDYVFYGIFIYKDATRSELTLSNCDANSKLYKVTDGEYSMIYADKVNPLAEETVAVDTTVNVATLNERLDNLLYYGWLQDSTGAYSCSQVGIENSVSETTATISINYKSRSDSASKNLVGATLYKIKEEE